MLNALSIDVEDWYHVEALGDVVNYRDWGKCESRLTASLTRLLCILDRRKVKATFFVLGWVAERFPEIVALIGKDGHEISTHGYAHRLIYKQNRREFELDLAKSLRAIEQTSPTEVIGYRAPSFSVVNETLWALEILADYGLKYDSSMFPIKHDRYGISMVPRSPFTVELNGKKSLLVEFPLSTVRVLGKNIPFSGGGYLRLFPYIFIQQSIKRVNSSGDPVIVYLHPWELDYYQPRLKANVISRFRQYTNLGLMEQKLEHLLRDFNFAPIREVLKEQISSIQQSICAV